VLLPVANAVIVPHLTFGVWLAPSLALCLVLSLWVHRHWYRGERDGGSRQSTVDGRQLSVDSRQSTVAGRQSSVDGRKLPVENPRSGIGVPFSSGDDQELPCDGRGALGESENEAADARRARRAVHSREHMWPSRPRGSWWKDLSWAGWAHVAYVAGELALLIGFLLFPMPDVVILSVCAIFTLHVPLGLLQPRWFLTGEIASPRQQPLLLPLLATLWVVGFLKL
jgi:hypothetical protein